MEMLFGANLSIVALIAVELILLLMFTEFEKWVSALLSLATFFCIVQFVSKVNVLGYVQTHPYHMVSFVAAYIILGIGWSVFKWRNFVLNRLEKYDEIYNEFLKDNRSRFDPSGNIPFELQRVLQRMLEGTTDKSGQTVADVPKASLNKSRIINWMAFWVFSMILYFCKDLVAELFSSIYKLMAGFLQRVADNIYSGRKIENGRIVPENKQDKS